MYKVLAINMEYMLPNMKKQEHFQALEQCTYKHRGDIK
jgi:hypothetical protein